MNENQTLEMQIKAKSDEALQSLNKLITKLTGIEKTINSVDKTVNKGTVKNVTTHINQLKNSTDTATNSVNKLNKALSFSGAYLGVKKLTASFLEWMDLAVDRTEQMNLFNVVFKNIEKDGVQTFSTLGKEATKFQYKLNEAFGTNMTETLKYQGLFQSMGENVGIPDTYSALMSETMTKLTYDLASLYNKSESTTGEALRAGVYAGQTKPLRAFGIDVTQTSMQPILDKLGITDRSVKQMTQAEKEILRYIATLEQAQVAMGDFANTIDSPANQLKIFKQQLVEAKVALTSLFIGSFAKILPYANAILMVIKEISKAIADMFGIELKDYNTGIASSEDAYIDLEDSIEGATDAVKELKRQTLGFDQINNINENTNSGSESSSIGGIDQRLLDAINGYDNGMDKVRMKATEIRDKIMEWLGFIKRINPLTGETYFEYQGIEKTLKNMWNSFKGLSTQGKILVGIGLATGALKLWNAGKKLVNVFGNSGLGKVVKNLLSPMKLLYNSLDDVNFANKSLTKGIAEGITNWSKSLTMADKFRVSLVGILGLTTSMNGMASAMNNISNEGWNLANSLQVVASGIAGIASGAYIGSIFGPWGTVIGGATGAVLELISALNGYQTETDKTISKIDENISKVEEYSNTLLNQYDTISKNLSDELSLTEVHSNLISELENIVDANGKVKSGYEERAQFIITTLNQAYGMEMSMVDGVIQKMDEQILKIKDVIAEKRKEIILESASESYKLAIEKKVETYKNLKLAQETYNDALKETNEAYNKWQEALKNANDKYDYISVSRLEKEYEKLNDKLKDSKKSLSEATEAYDANTTAIMNYQGLLSADAQANAETIEHYMNQIENTYYDGKNTIKLTYEEQLKDAQEYYSSVIRTAQTNGQEITSEIEAQANSRLNVVKENLINQSQTVNNLSDDIVNSWKLLAKYSANEFNSTISKLPTDVQNELLKIENSVNSSLGYGSNVYSSFSSVGIALGQTLGNNISNNIKINGNTLNSTWNNATKGIQDKLLSLGGLLGTGALGLDLKIRGYANGGFPEDGWFRASHGELMGKFDNGKSVVANNMQITEGIEEAAYRGYMRAIRDSNTSGGQTSQIDVHVHTDEGTIIDKIEQRTKQTGVFPFTIPTC